MHCTAEARDETTRTGAEPFHFLTVMNVMDALEAMRVALGPGVLLNYTLQGLFQ